MCLISSGQLQSSDALVPSTFVVICFGGGNGREAALTFDGIVEDALSNHETICYHAIDEQQRCSSITIGLINGSEKPVGKSYKVLVIFTYSNENLKYLP